MVEHLKALLTDQLALMRAAVQVLDESRSRVSAFADRLDSALTISERESCEALTSRFARLNDFLLQRVFRTLDQIELADEGTALDRLQRAEARGLISSAERWRELRLLRNAIAHDYLIESADRVLRESLTAAPELIETAECVGRYVHAGGWSKRAASHFPIRPGQASSIGPSSLQRRSGFFQRTPGNRPKSRSEV